MLTVKFRMLRKAALVMVFLLVYQIVFPVAAYALTSGPTQPEFQAFEPVGTTEMVDLFSGDFTYNIPLFDLPGPNGGYPFNISYKPETNIDAESGPFGLGWTINPGVINRSMRGIPDDADGSNGDVVTTTTSIRDNWTVGGGMGGSIELFGFLDLKLGRGTYFNSYKGIGQIKTVGLNLHSGTDSGPTAGLSLTSDSQNGISINASLGLTAVAKDQTTEFGLGIGVNSRAGLTGLSLNGSLSKSDEFKSGGEVIAYDKGAGIGSGGSNISFGSPANVPEVSMPWRGSNASLLFRLGGSLWGVFGNAYVKGYYNHQGLANKGKPVSKPAFGYLNMHKPLLAGNTDVMLDYNRLNDGPISKNSLNLAIPNTTPDIYSLSGQGVGGMFRAYRSDMGVLHSNRVESRSGGGNLSADAFVFKGGFSFGGNYSESSSGKWTDGNGLLSDYDFHEDVDGTYEPAYFKMQGEHNAENTQGELSGLIGGTAPMRVDINGMDAGTNFISKNGNTETPAPRRTERNPRSNSVLQLKNSELLAGQPLSEFDIQYFNGSNNLVSYNDNERRDNDHIGAFISYDPSGMRYNYGIPAYNNVHRERLFSVDGSNGGCGDKINTVPIQNGEVRYQNLTNSDRFFQKTEFPSYAHAYLLTSVLGASYVDVDQNGLSENDLGYWVDFKYKKMHDNFKWRAPYSGYNFNEGYKVKNEDDKASFLYGEKEIWNLARVETKTHIAIFNLTPRHDGKAAAGEFVNSNSAIGTDGLYKVSDIKLYTRNEFNNPKNGTSPVPLKTINFEYSYELCPGTENSKMVPNSNQEPNPNKGKLTLKKIWFTYDNSTRGELSPYIFNYEGANHGYDENRHDRWGIFKGISGTDECENVDLPYTRQFSEDRSVSEEAFEEGLAADAAAWSLSSIVLPSGAKIEVDWEPNSYAHVQNRTATQMFQIVSTKESSSTNNDCVVGYDRSNLLRIYDRTVGTPILSRDDRKIYFQLEHPLNDNDNLEAEMRKYFEDLQVSNAAEGTRQIYYKVNAEIRNGIFETISGYTDIRTAIYGLDFGVDINSKDDCLTDHYTRGFVVLDHAKIGDSQQTDFHPFALAAWQKMKADFPDIAFDAGNIDPNAPVGAQAIKQILGSILSPVAELGSMFSGYWKYCRQRGFAQQIQQANSVIRLNSPDKKKYGSGARVKSIVLKDNWQNDNGNNPTDDPDTYGQVYHYEDGVAAYEPMIGGDENALRYARNYERSVPLSTSQNLFSEFPMNENYYPGPRVGYGKVTVTSLATHLAGADAAELLEFGVSPTDLPDGFATTGKVVNEFYTAKEFPVISDQTEINIDKDGNYLRRQIPYFPFGQTVIERNTVSQGYSIELNDMHGKPKKVSHYAQDMAGSFSAEPESWVRYNYQYQERVVDGRKVKVLDNEVDVLLSNSELDTQNRLLRERKNIGMDVESFNDMRQFNSTTTSVGAQFNLDGIYFFFGVIPIPTVWPDVSHQNTQMRTAVNNKIINRSGILRSTDAFDNGAMVHTENLLFDGMTGQPLLTAVNNSYMDRNNKVDDKIYSYNVPGHLVYDGMGAAYQNLGMEFSGVVVSKGVNSCDANYKVTQLPADIQSALVEGDEFIIRRNSGNQHKGTFIGEEGGQYYFYIEGITGLTLGFNADFKLTRSGRRNHLTASVGNITALSDPTSNRREEDCTVDVIDPYWAQITTGSIVTIDDDLALINAIFAGGHLAGIENNPLDLSATFGAMYDVTGIEMNGLTHLGYSPASGLTFTDGRPAASCSQSKSSLNLQCCSFLIWTIVNGAYSSFDLQDMEDIASINVNSFVPGPGQTSAGTIIINNIDESSEEVNISFCGGIEENEYDDIIVLDSREEDIDFHAIDNILATSATTYKDTWITDQDAIVDNMNNNVKENPYAEGKKGIWRAHKSYAYVDARNQEGDGGVASTTSAMGTKLDTRHDGVFDNLAVFEYDHMLFEQCNDWVMANEMTQYSGNNEIENRNILDQYSSAIYGYYDNLATAVAANSSHRAFGFESFEELGTGTLTALANDPSQPKLTGQIDILPLPNGTEKELFDRYPIVVGEGEGTLVVQRPFNANWNPQSVSLSIQRLDGSEAFVTADITKVVRVQDTQGNYLAATGLELSFTAGCEASIGANEQWFGEAAFSRLITTTGASATTVAEITTERAHTGTKSLKVEGASVLSQTSFAQNSLDLIDGNEYVISLWLSEEDMQKPTFSNSNYIFMNTIWGGILQPKGEIINGWQRAEGTFTAASQNTLYSFGFNDRYIDDIRIFPADANMQSYVYDPHNYRLKATLDNNNFATLYYYDAEGNVSIVKKETAEGIVTIQENTNYVKPNN